LARDDDRATMGVWKWKHAIRQASERQTGRQTYSDGGVDGGVKAGEATTARKRRPERDADALPPPT
jgi:hypothetical protein